jgi:hypothetical protein
VSARLRGRLRFAARNSDPQQPVDAKENNYEGRCTKKFAQTQETKEAPCFEKVHGGEEVKRNGSVKIKHSRREIACFYREFVCLAQSLGMG